MTWTQLVNPNYILLLPEIIVVVTTLAVLLLDLYVKEKRSLVWATLAGVALALGAVWFSATDKVIQTALNAGQPLEFFGKMVVADQFSFFMKAVILGVVGLMILLSVDYVEKYLKGMFMEFYQVLLVASLGAMFMVGSRDLLMIYVGLEVSSISSYVLAGLLRKDAKSNEAALKYFLNGALASAVLLFGLSLIYGVTGTTYLPEIGETLANFANLASQEPGLIALVAAGVLFLVGGFSFKVAAVPMHLWAPDVYEGSPTPITGFFSVGPKGAAFAAILRIFVVGMGVSEFSQRWVLVWAVLAAASMFLGNLTALLQSNIKRMMAYSSIAQAGYILVGVVAAGQMPAGEGTASVLYYVMAYALTNLGIFAVLTHMDQAGGWVTVDDFKGLVHRSPVYAWAMLLFFISLIGIPPTVGFMGKFMLFRSAAEAGYLWLALIMAVNSAISVGYYYGVVKAMFLEKSDRGPLPASGGAMTAVVIATVGVVLAFVLASPVLGFTKAATALLLR